MVVEAYSRPEAEGLLQGRAGAGTRVTPHARAGSPGGSNWPARQRTAARHENGPGSDGWIRVDLRAGAPDLGRFPRARWLAASRAALASVPNSGLGYPDPAGHAGLRTELAGYLGRVRAAVADPQHVVIVCGVAQALTLTGRALAAAGHRALAVEDPCSSRVLPLLAATELRLVAVPVDSEGIDVDALARTTARAVLVTPAHQYPTGVVLSPRRRSALAAWARDRNGLVIEDDYDASPAGTASRGYHTAPIPRARVGRQASAVTQPKIPNAMKLATCTAPPGPKLSALTGWLSESYPCLSAPSIR